MSSTYQQAAIPIGNPQAYGAVHQAIEQAFGLGQVSSFLRSLEKASVRIREFESVLGGGLLGGGAEGEYRQLGPGDQGQIREFYLHALEGVAPPLRQKYFRLYAYY